MAKILVAVNAWSESLSTVRGLRAAGHTPLAAASQAYTYAEYSRSVADVVRVSNPRQSTRRFVVALASAAESLDAAAILPATEPALTALTRHESLLPADVAVGTAPPDALDRATDKAKLPEFAAAAGLTTPLTFRTSRGNVEDAISQTGVPCVVKPLRSVVEYGDALREGKVDVITSKDGLTRCEQLSRGEEVLVQKQVTGRLEAVCGVAWEGKLVCAMHQVSLRIWPVHHGVSSFAVTARVIGPARPESLASSKRLAGAASSVPNSSMTARTRSSSTSTRGPTARWVWRSRPVITFRRYGLTFYSAPRRAYRPIGSDRSGATSRTTCVRWWLRAASRGGKDRLPPSCLPPAQPTPSKRSVTLRQVLRESPAYAGGYSPMGDAARHLAQTVTKLADAATRLAARLRMASSP